MRLIPTSSLDIIDPPAPFVPATSWNQLRNEIRASRVLGIDNREPTYRDVATNACSLNQYNGEWQANTIATNIVKNPFRVRLEPEIAQVSSAEIDVCFADSSLDFLLEPSSNQVRYELQQDTVGAEGDYDLELGLLESVQEIAVSLQRQTPRRVKQPTTEATNY